MVPDGLIGGGVEVERAATRIIILEPSRRQRAWLGSWLGGNGGRGSLGVILGSVPLGYIERSVAVVHSAVVHRFLSPTGGQGFRYRRGAATEHG